MVSNCKHEGEKMVHHIGENGKVVMKGWYCPTCGNFFKSIGRERKIPIEDRDLKRWLK